MKSNSRPANGARAPFNKNKKRGVLVLIGKKENGAPWQELRRTGHAGTSASINSARRWLDECRKDFAGMQYTEILPEETADKKTATAGDSEIEWDKKSFTLTTKEATGLVTVATVTLINELAPRLLSDKMRYPSQMLLEEVIKELNKRV